MSLHAWMAQPGREATVLLNLAHRQRDIAALRKRECEDRVTQLLELTPVPSRALVDFIADMLERANADLIACDLAVERLTATA